MLKEWTKMFGFTLLGIAGWYLTENWLPTLLFAFLGSSIAHVIIKVFKVEN